MSIAEDEDRLDVEPGVTGPEEAAGSRSLLDRIKARRDESDDVLELDIPSWGGELKARYRVVAKAELEKMVRKIRARQSGNGSNDGTEVDLDFLISACIGVIAEDAESMEREEVASGYNAGLADILGHPDGTGTARGLVLYLFKHNGIALAAHSMKVARWMQDTSKRPDSDPQ